MLNQIDNNIQKLFNLNYFFIRWKNNRQVKINYNLIMTDASYVVGPSVNTLKV
jgi:hypothetical protein